jgi:hypothetical protein
MTDEELIEALRSIDHMNVDDCFLQSHLYSKAADRIEALVNERDGLLRVVTDNHVALLRAEAAEAKLAKAVDVLQLAYSTLTEINPSNYDHDDVCEQNNASVEVILSIAAVLDELEKTE